MNRFLFGVPEHFWILRASLLVICAAQQRLRRAAGAVSGRVTGCRVRRFRGRFRDRGGKTTLGRQRRPGDDGDSEGFGDPGPRRRDCGSAGGGAGSSAGRPGRAFLLHADLGSAAGGSPGSRGPENVIAESGRELQRQLLESTFTIDCAREERTAPLISAAGIRHGTIEKGRDRGVVSIFGPVRAGRMAYRSTREANLYPADA